MATLGTVKLLSRGSGEDLGNLPEAEGRWARFLRSSPLRRDNGLTVPQVALK